MTCVSRRQSLATTLLIATLAAPVVAQDASAEPRLFTRNDVLLAGVFAAGTGAMFPLDRRIIASVRDSGRLHDAGLRRAARVAGFLGSPGSVLVAATFYAAGEVWDEPGLSRLGVHTGEAIVAGGLVAGVLKTVLGRARPSVSADTNPADFRLLRGFRSDAFQAFPSGHTSVAFAAAAAITSEMHGRSEEVAWIAGPLLYSGATLVGLSRMYEDKHWPSDIVMGAAIGTFAGMKAVRFTRTAAGRRLDRRLLGDDAQVRIGYFIRW